MTDKPKPQIFENALEVYSKADIDYYYQMPGGFDFLGAMLKASASHAVLVEDEMGRRRLRPALIGDIVHLKGHKEPVTITAASGIRRNLSDDFGEGFAIETASPEPNVVDHYREINEPHLGLGLQRFDLK